ncbi:D-serine dehydratase; AltName: Full=D-serine deaminase; Short=DSD [Serendipita indica DSM 11827]|nr:D-serine dehydratase; AltName: Full=D-serine deaminase; Short=DSD [Serendipita indica DSM 11827]
MAQYQLPPQSFTPDVTTPPKGTLLAKYKGAPVTSVRTPALFIDQAVFKRNCARMHSSVKAWGASFRAHVKTHKTVEGVRLQLQSGAGTTTAVVVSTIMEAWEIILYGLPVAPSKLADLAKLEHAMQTVNPNACLRLMIDNIYQVRALESYGEKVWSTFVKVDHGGHRAGLPVGSDALRELVTTMIESPSVHIHGFYCHAGDSYASTTLHQASSFLTVEMHAVDAAATMALSILEARPEINSSKYKKPFVLSVGSTPTAHTTHLVSSPADALAQEFTSGGVLEIHAGNYPVRGASRACGVISAYPARGEGGVDEAMCDAGGIAMSRDTGPSGGFGDVVPW